MCPAPPYEPYAECKESRQLFLPLEVVACESVQLDHAEGAAAAAPLTFRGKPIAWTVVPTTKRIVLPNAFGENEIEEE